MPDEAQQVQNHIVNTLVGFLKDNESVCAKINPIDAPFIRYTDGMWQYARRDRKREATRWTNRIHGGVYDEETVIELFQDRKVVLHPCVAAGYTDESVWEIADKQDVFTSHDRCVWCGHSERTRTLNLYETEYRFGNDVEPVCSECVEQYGDTEYIVGLDT